MVGSQVARAHAPTATCYRLWCAVDDGAGLVSAAVAAGLDARPGAVGTRLELAAEEPAALVELGLGGCACTIVTRDFEPVVELTRRLLASQRRVQLFLSETARGPSSSDAPAKLALKSLVISGASALPPGRVVEIVARP